MSSDLRHWADDYLQFRASVGFRTDGQRRLLANFLDHLDGQQIPAIRVRDALAWACSPQGVTPGWRAYRLATVRGFAAHVHAGDPGRAELIPAGLLSGRRNRGVPYIYTDDQIRGLIQVAGRLAPSVRGHTTATIIALMAATGIRTSEAVGLNTESLDNSCATIEVVGKGGSRRVLPVHPTTVAALVGYLKTSRELVGEPTGGSLFVTLRATRPLANSVQTAFREVADDCRLPLRPGRRPPRLHDLRHSFAVNTLLEAHRSGLDVTARIAVLSTYLGHATPANTYWYLTSTPELLELVADRVQDEQLWCRP